MTVSPMAKVDLLDSSESNPQHKSPRSSLKRQVTAYSRTVY